MVTGSKCKVRFVDYANAALVDEVYDITPEQVSHPPQAVRCALDQVGKHSEFFRRITKLLQHSWLSKVALFQTEALAFSNRLL